MDLPGLISGIAGSVLGLFTPKAKQLASARSDTLHRLGSIDALDPLVGAADGWCGCGYMNKRYG